MIQEDRDSNLHESRLKKQSKCLHCHFKFQGMVPTERHLEPNPLKIYIALPQSTDMSRQERVK